MSLVNDSLKFTSSNKQICWNFLLKNVSSFCSAKATHIFSESNIRILYIESAETVNEMTLNELVKLTTLWTTGPRSFSDTSLDTQMSFFGVKDKHSKVLRCVDSYVKNSLRNSSCLSSEYSLKVMLYVSLICCLPRGIQSWVEILAVFI